MLVDDGSPDSSGEICDGYAKQDRRIQVIHKKNGGACEARNAGLNLATGEYVSIIDGDDWLELDYVEYLLNLAESSKSNMAMTDKVFTTRDRNRVQIKDDKTEVWTSERAAASIISYIPIGPWNKLYSMELLKTHNISFSVPWSGEGLYFSFMAAQYSNHVAVGHKKIYNYRRNNAESGLTNYNVQMGINAVWNIRNIKKNIAYDSKIIHDAVNWHIWKNYHFLAFLIIATHSQKQYENEYNECLKEQRKIFSDCFENMSFWI
ncbi:MAG: glycosyltransferase [Butyrivibrio sp.]|nr:glycosyltransferase [Butyrivibrio sp.]